MKTGVRYTEEEQVEKRPKGDGFVFLRFIFQSKNMKTKYNKSQLITNQNVLKFMASTTWS